MENHLFQLLHSHECIVVPQFGAFVLRYYPAEFQEGTMLFRPPSRRVCFQPELKENDGILAHYIAKNEGVSYREAERSISREVQNWKNLLHSGHSVSLPGIGKIYSIKDNTYEFFPELNSNFMRDSYGLQIIRTSNASKINEVQNDEVVVKELRHVSPWGKRLLRIAAVAVPVFIAIQITSTTPKQTFNSVYDAAMSILPIKMSSQELATEVRTNNLEEANEFKNTESQSVIGVAEPEESEMIPIVEEAPVVLSPTHHIIVGAFGEINNAKRYVETLRQKGVNASIIEGNGKLNRVSAGEYYSLHEAESALKDVKIKIESGAWLLAL